MADTDDPTGGARFQPSVPARAEVFGLKGSGSLDWGMQSRLARIFRPATWRTVMLAIDHGYFQGPTTGLERVDLSIVPLLPHADALMTTRGMVRSTVPPATRTPIVLRASGGPSVLKELSDEQIAVSMADAARINAAAVAVQVFIGGEFETQSVRNMTRLVDQSQQYGIPVLAVTAVGKELTRDARYLRLATRICAELGAHVVKTYYCAEGFDTVTAACPVPLVMAGGKKLPELDALTMAHQAIEAGAAGVDMGRNIFQSDYPAAMIRAIGAVVHESTKPVDAYEEFVRRRYRSEQTAPDSSIGRIEMAHSPGGGPRVSAGTPTQPGNELKAGVISLPGVLMQSVTSIAPAIAGLFTVPFIVANAGVGAPLAYLGAFIIALFLGYVLAQFSRHLSSSGSYYTFVSRSLGGRPGFLVAWVYLLFYPVVVAQVGSFMGSTLQSTLKAEYGITFEWWWFMIFLIALVAWTAWRGVELSVNLIIVLGLIEGVIVLALGLWGFASPGPGGVNLDWLSTAGHSGNLHGLFLGVVFAIFAITGWDAAAPLAEESRDPKRNIPRAVLGSIVILGIFLVLVSWGQITGWGTARLASFSGSAELPAFVLGKQYWGDGWLVVLFALFNSAIAVAIACTNASTRFLYGMARAKALPAALTKIHPAYETPTTAIIVQTGINIALGLVLPLAIGVANVYNVTGTWFTFALAFVYIMANIGLYVFYRREHADEFSWLKHLIIPAIGSVGLAVVVYYSVNPLPAWPVSLAPFIVAGWLVVGIIVVAIVYRGPRAANLALAGAAMGEVVSESSTERLSVPEAVRPPDPVG